MTASKKPIPKAVQEELFKRVMIAMGITPVESGLPKNVIKRLGPQHKTWKYPPHVPNVDHDQLRIRQNKVPGRWP